MRFGRKSQSDAAPGEEAGAAAPGAAPGPDARHRDDQHRDDQHRDDQHRDDQHRAERTGPIDASEVDPATTYIDLGSLLVPPQDGLDLRLQVDEQSGSVMTVLLTTAEGVLEMRAFSSSRGGDLWSDARKEIAADTTRRGGTATEQDGGFGTELFCQVPVTGPNGESLMQPSRIIGVTGPRWFLRATMAGRPALDAGYAEPFERALRSVAVRRGAEAMPPGEALPLRMPPESSATPDPGGDD